MRYWGTVTTEPKPNFQLECQLRDELGSHHNPFLESSFTWNSWNSITHWACHSFNLNAPHNPTWLSCCYHGSQSHYSADKLICWELPLLTFHPKVDKAKFNNRNYKELEFLEVRGDIIQSIWISSWKVAKEERISFNPKQLPLWKFYLIYFIWAGIFEYRSNESLMTPLQVVYHILLNSAEVTKSTTPHLHRLWRWWCWCLVAHLRKRSDNFRWRGWWRGGFFGWRRRRRKSVHLWRGRGRRRWFLWWRWWRWCSRSWHRTK